MPKREEHTGVITDNRDPEKRGRVSVECPTIVAGDILEWVEPEFHFVDSHKTGGAFFVPNVGSQVTVSIEAEEDSEVQGLEPRWRCTVYQIGKVPEVFTQNYPERRGWVTGNGHVMYFDDTLDEETFHYEHPTGATIQVNNDGDIILTPASGRSVKVGGDDATEALVLGDELQSYFNTIATGLIALLNGHVHSGGTLGGGLTGPPNGTAGTPGVVFSDLPDTVLSDDNKVK